MVEERRPRVLRAPSAHWLLAGGLVLSLVLSLAGLAGPLASPQVAGRPVLLSRASWAARHYLAAADGWLMSASQQEERILLALGPRPGLDWPTPAGGWPESLYEQASLARGASAELDRLARTAHAYALPADLLPAHESVAAYLDSAAAFAEGVLDYLGGPDEAKLPALVSAWRAAQAQRQTAVAALDRQRAASGWERGIPGLKSQIPNPQSPTPMATIVGTVFPARPSLFATHTPLAAGPSPTPMGAAGGTATLPPYGQSTSTAATTATVPATPTPRGVSGPATSPSGTAAASTPAPERPPASPGLFATHTPVR